MQRTWLRRALATALLLVATFAGFMAWRMSRALHSAAIDVRTERQVRFLVRSFPKTVSPDFEVISSPAVFSQAARFQDDLYIAGPACLFEYDPAGNLLRRFDVGRELPASPLVAIAPATLTGSAEPELVIATAQEGLLAFNGRTFRQIYPEDAQVRAITAILPVASGHLLIGTSKRGVLVFDGKQIVPLHPSLTDLHVTALGGSESDLWVGTMSRGVLHFHAGTRDTFSESDGLPDPNVQSLATSANVTYVGTPAGVALFQGARFSRVLAPGVFAAALLVREKQLYIGTEDQGVIVVPLEGRQSRPYTAPVSQLSEVHQLLASGDTIYAVARAGLFQLHPHAFGWTQAVQPDFGILSDRNISALATDAGGRLWVGYFDRGLDIVPSDNLRPKHIEDEHVFCVNRVFPDTRSGIVNVATANGLVRFDNAGAEQQVLTRADGLIADHVTDVAAYRDGLALATPAGLTFLDAGGASSMYTFNGIVNNHVYALGVSGDQLLAGTLGGISVLDRGNVSVNYSTATSNLKHNWITAVVPVGDEWMIGTYGAGVLSLDRSGHFHSFEKASGSIEINPNAMLVTPSYVLAGTLGNGLFLFDRQSGRWSVIQAGLPSSNVTALAAGNGYIYVGTDNGLVRISEQKLHS